jgi:hypothetical protein
MKAGKTFGGYTIVSNSSYNIAIDGFGTTNTTYVNYTIAHSANNTNEAIYALLSPEYDSLVLPTKTFTSVSSYFTTTVSGMICNSTTQNVTGCYYNGLCSDIIGKLSNLWFSFGGDGVKYVVPPQSYLTEDATALICRAKISKTTGNTITLG